MSTLLERTDCSGNVWYWVKGEDDTAPFYAVPEFTNTYATEKAALHRCFNQLITTKGEEP